MADKKRYSIGILIGGVHTYFPKELIRGIIMASRELNVDVSFFLGTQTRAFFHDIIPESQNSSHDYQFNTIYDYSLLYGLDGLIINYGTLGIYMDDGDIHAFARKFHFLPTIFLTDIVDEPNCHSIISDNYYGVCQIMEHFICHHHYRKILFMCGPDKNTDAAERLRAYLDSMKKYHLDVTPEMLGKGNFSEFENASVEKLLDDNPDAEAIVFANDEMAFSGYKVCQKRGITVGKDIAFAGFDNCELAASILPPLTTVSQDGILMGRTAMYDIVDLCSGRRTLPAVKRIPVSMIVRESCGCTLDTPASENTPEDLTRKIQELSHSLTDMKQDFINFQRKSWFIPILVRDLNECVEDAASFCLQTMEKLKELKAKSAYLLLLDTPVSYNGKSSWQCPDTLRLASYLKDGTAATFSPYDRPVISREHPVFHIINDTCRQYLTFLLFSGERQYGLLMCDVELDDFSYFFIISLQIGLCLRYLEISRIEAAHRRKMSQDIEKMKKKNRELNLKSGYDELTGLLNLRGFTEQIAEKCRYGSSQKAYLIYGDLDHLKEINDSWGHPEGDFAIRSAGNILKQCIRESDILARIGGDEFICLVISEADSFEKIFLGRLSLACQKLNRTSGKPFYVELSVGISHFVLDDTTDIQAVIAASDKKLYQAKRHRRASVKKELLKP